MTSTILPPQDRNQADRGISLFVGGLHNAADLVNQHRITHAISLRDPASLVPDLGLSTSCHRGFTMIDTEDPRALRAPQLQQVKEILQFARALPPEAKLLIHCHAGIRRSSACALAVLAQRFGMDDPERLPDLLTQTICENPIPNLLITFHADRILGLNGRLNRLAIDIGRATLQAQHGMLINQDSPPLP